MLLYVAMSQYHNRIILCTRHLGFTVRLTISVPICGEVDRCSEYGERGRKNGAGGIWDQET